MKPPASHPPERKIADVCIGDVYQVSRAGRRRPVEIVSREDSGIWTARDLETHQDLIVVFADLGDKVSPGKSAALIADAAGGTVIPLDRKTLAAGDRE